MSGGLAPSKSTVYVSNLVYSLTNNDLHKIFSKHGPIVKVTLVKDRGSRKSKGVAFVQYMKRDDAHECVRICNGKVMFGRTIKCSIAKDNGKSAEFIKKKLYPDKSSCYECGEEGHLSYACPKNSLGRRTPPPKKEPKKKSKQNYVQDEESDADSERDDDQPDLETLSAAIEMEQQARFEPDSTRKPAVQPKRKIIKKNSYFSDEEDLSD